MKTVSVITLILGAGAAANAAAIANGETATLEARQWCPRRGQPCWKVKRAVEAFVSAIHSNEARDVATTTSPSDGHLTARDLSHLPGGAAYNAKRSVNALAALLASTQDDPEAFYNDLYLDRYFDPDTSVQAKAVDEKPAADADADAPKTEKPDEGAAPLLEARQWCPRRGQPCWKRDVEHDKRHCDGAGEACDVAKRAVGALLAAVEGSSGGADLAKRQWCPRRGQPCWKRDNVFEPVALGRRDVSDAEADLLTKRQWCPRRGQPCWKRSEISGLEARCYGPAGDCTKAQRDLNAIHLAARDVLASLE
ncbi:hypothetical protein PpBr36_03753 [Pyricularia pennisetigena]|uniref:hypothetical protein n=1 Tax=Pyricularia pennisetigena TaxID=1578925 RepID=UPI00114DDB8B|nr:hypothetical protein PpBr36_03753 [Pyricularia pennisetigena]TLS30223.1 hypothetical protein PpBr36_03753 [Pyricularia pennisetigena]